MDGSFREQGSGAQQDPNRFWVRPTTLLASLIKSLFGLFYLTEEEREDAGIYIGRLGDE